MNNIFSPEAKEKGHIIQVPIMREFCLLAVTLIAAEQILKERKW